MKNILGSFFLMAAVALTGCGGDKKNNDGRQGNGRGGNVAGPTTPTGSGNQNNQNPNNQNANNQNPNKNIGTPANLNQNPGLFGQIIPRSNMIKWADQPLSNQPFLDNDVLRLFLTTNLEPNLVGATNNGSDQNYNKPCQQGQKCTVVMSMPLTLASQTLSQAMSSQSAISSGTLSIIVYDSLVGIKADDGSTITPFPIYLNLDPNFQSFVRGNQLIAQFADGLGTVLVKATIQNGAMTGSLDFNNLNSFKNENEGAAGTLGTMQINTCSVFGQQCQ